MNPDQDGTSDNLGLLPQQPAQIRVDVKFSQNLKHAIQMIVYFESPTIVTVDVLRRVTVIHK